jgi:hypothetical protein
MNRRHGPGPGSNEADGRSRFQKRRIRGDNGFSYVSIHGRRPVQSEQALTSHYGKHRMDLMQHKFVATILLLVFALLVQNTCPHGFAGKSSIVSSCVHCPFEQMHLVSPAHQDTIAAGSASIHFPLFVFSVPHAITTLQPGPILSMAPPLAKSYEDALPDELLRPPQA